MVLNYTEFDGAISYLMVLLVRMMLRKEEFFLRSFVMYILMISILLYQTLNMAAPFYIYIYIYYLYYCVVDP